MNQLTPHQKLFFVLGKGGVGRTSVSVALAKAFEAKGERVLIVQWALRDSVSPIFGKQPVEHDETPVSAGISVINYEPDEAIREYFVDHLKMKLLYRMVIENKHVQKLIHAAPGINELFFLGRLFWLVKLAGGDRGWEYDRIIVDAPATGHGVSLFTLASTIASFGITGPLAYECERVSELLSDENLVGTVVVTLPEELPVEETFEFVPKVSKDLGRPPLFLCVNRALPASFNVSVERLLSGHAFPGLTSRLESEISRSEIQILFRDLGKRMEFENTLRSRFEKENNIPVLSLQDVLLLSPEARSLSVVKSLAQDLGRQFEGATL